MSQERAFIEAIIARPDDDLPRLIYADWLGQNGEPEREEFIRVQVEIVQLTDDRTRDDCQCPRCIKVDALRCRERELLRGPRPDIYENEVIWFNEGNGTDNWRVIFRPQWRRGFVAAVICTAADWLFHSDQITAAAPIEEVTLTTEPEWRLGRCGACQGCMARVFVRCDRVTDELRRRWPRVKTWNLPRETQFNQPNPAGQLIHRFQACTACGGDGLSTPPPEARPCRRCNGAGRLPMPRRAAVAPSR